MTDLLTMQQLLCALLITSGGLRLIRRTLCSPQHPMAQPAILLLFAVLTAAFCLIVARFGGMALLLPALLMLVSAGTLAAAAQGLPQLPRPGGVIPALLLALWLAALLALTVLLREPSQTNVLLHFDALADVARLGSVRPLTDVLLNAALFLPLGLLLPQADANPRAPWLNVLSAALLLTAAIEGLQLLFQLGQADVEDLLANVLGAMAGWGLQRLLRKTDPS